MWILRITNGFEKPFNTDYEARDYLRGVFSNVAEITPYEFTCEIDGIKHSAIISKPSRKTTGARGSSRAAAYGAS